jgi:hypothetical protein
LHYFVNTRGLLTFITEDAVEGASSGTSGFEYVVVNILCGYVAYLYYMGYRINFELYTTDYDHDHCTW